MQFSRMLGRNYIRQLQLSLHGDHDPSRLVSALLLCVLLGVLAKFIKKTGIFGNPQRRARRRRRKRSREFSRFVNEHVDLHAGMAPYIFDVNEEEEGKESPTKRKRHGRSSPSS